MPSDEQLNRAAEKMQSVGQKLTLWVSIPILIVVAVVWCSG